RSQTGRRCVTEHVYRPGMYKTIAVCALTAVCLSSCGKGKDSGGGGGSGSAPVTKPPGDKPPPAPGGSATLNGSGSSFQKQYQEAAIEAFNKSHKNVSVN